jgi:cation transport ATPase
MKRSSRRPKRSAAEDEATQAPAAADTNGAPPEEQPSPPGWQVASDLPGRTRFRHLGLRSDLHFARRVEAELASAHGVTDWHIRPLTGSLLVHFDRRAITRSQLTHLLERALDAPEGLPDLDRHPSPISFGLANGSVALAAAGELALPALLPASAVLLVASNLKVLRQSWRELRQRQLGLPTLFTTIIVGTLASGQFLAASLMAWMMAFWRFRHRAAQFRLRRQLLSPLIERRRFARLLVGGQEVEVPTQRLAAGDHIVVEEGELIPADGILLGGPALVDERLIRGVTGHTWKKAGEPVYAGSISFEGRIVVEVSAHGESTRAAGLSRELAAVHLPTRFAVTPHGEEFGRRAVAPTLAAAGVGLLVGDVTTAAAILRPDYATGPGLGVSLETLRDIAECARLGVLIRDPAALVRIASADIFILDDLPILEHAGLKATSVVSLDGSHEADILRHAATAFGCLADSRAEALTSACQSNQIEIPAVRASYRGSGVTWNDGSHSICVREALGQDSPDPAACPLEVLIDSRLAGRVRFGPSPDPASTEAIGQLRSRGVVVALFSHRPAEEVESLATSLGIEMRAFGLSSDAKVELLKNLARRGRKVAYVGDPAREPEVAREAHVSISIAALTDPASDQSHVRMLRGDLRGLAPLHELARAHLDRVRVVHGAILVPNLACIAGAFFLGFTSLASVVITNLGTLAIYSGLPRRIKARSTLNRRPGPDR